MSTVPSPVALENYGNSGRPRSSASAAPVYVAAALIYCFLFPPQFNISLSGIVLSPYRLFLIGASLWLLARGLNTRIRPHFADWLIFSATLWIGTASYMVTDSIAKAIEIGGSHFVDIALPYFMARATIRSAADLRVLLILIAPGLAIVGLSILAESLSHRYIVQPLASALTGAPYPPRFEIRMGLGRGMGPLHHPILAGIFLGSFLPLYLLSGLRGWPKIAGLLASVFAFFTMSSAAVLALVAGGVLSLYNLLTEKVRGMTWRLFLLAMAAAYSAVELLSNRSFYQLLIDYASLRQVSAYNRILIWKFGTENVSRHPWFGIGYADWDRPVWMGSSFDHFWLLMALRFGVPVSLFILLATVIGVIALALRSRHQPRTDARMTRAVAISLAVLALGVSSVALWQSTLAWYFMLLGIAIGLGQASATASHPRSVARAPSLAQNR